MSTLLIQAGAAGAGFLIGGPTGAQWGWAAGGLLAQAFAPPQELPPQFGPRLNDLKVQAATYGMTIPRAYGTVRLAGNIIWTTDIIETPTTTTVEQGGKGGGGTEQQQTTYAYSQSFAVGLCEGEILGVRRIWANGKLIYSVADDADGSTILASIPGVTVYTGSETQVASALQESYLGAGNVPAYRGLAYVEFTDLQLEQFGNRTPNLEFEVVVEGTVYGGDETSLYVPGSPTPTIPSYILLSDNGVLWYMPSARTPLTAVDLATGAILYEYNLSAAQQGVPLYVDEDDTLWAWKYNGGLSSNKLFSFTTAGVQTEHTMSQTTFLEGASPAGFDESGNAWVRGTSGGTIERISGTDITTLSNPYSNVLALMNRAGDIPGRMYIYTDNSTGTRGWGYYDTSTLAFTNLHSVTGGGERARRGIVDPAGFIYIGDEADTTNIEKWDQDGNFIAALTLTGNTDFRNAVLDDIGNLWVHGIVGSARVFQIDTDSFTLVATHVITGHLLVEGNPYRGLAALTWEDDPGAFQVFAIFGADLIEPGAADLGEIVSDLCQQSQLTDPEIVVTDLTGTEIDGYVISAIGTVRGMIEPLAQAFHFDAVESDDTVKFVTRGGAAAVTIPQTDLAAHSSGSEPPAPIDLTRREEMDLPVEVNLTYMSRANNYQPGTQRARRLTTSSKMKAQLPFPIVMTDDKAQQIADAILYAGWQERDSVEFYTGRKYAKYEPTDVLGVTVDTNIYRVRVTQKDVGANGVIKWQGVVEGLSDDAVLADAPYYVQTSVGAIPDALTEEEANEIPLPPESVIEFLDVPLLRDIDDSNPGFYVAVRGRTDAAWRGQQLYREQFGSYAALANGSTVAEATMGEASTVLGNCTRCGQFDESTSVTVVLDSGTLASAARADVMAGANAAILGDEIIQFRTATLTAANTYLLTGLLRGRLGTEWATGTHAVGDRFVLLDTNLRAITQQWSDVGIEYDYKAVTFGRSLAQSDAEAFTNTAVRKKPLPPIRLAAARDLNGDWQIKWVRQTRLSANWRDSVDAPLGETTELYHIDVMNGATAVRTITATSTSASYTQAQEVADFGSPTPISALTLNVYQISSEYGRGRAAMGTFT